ncbi:histone H4-like [Cyprinus carpio]|uniref:Histone H4-like n=1 Tax=Cyprinus carpio TaxID=7962 RepID=A0A9Q9W5P2_CYPCA|nr:histone H4-like [Cyprinus carpio]
MSERGKGGKGLREREALKSVHRKVLRDDIQGIAKPAVNRLARRSGVKRISGPDLRGETPRCAERVFLEAADPRCWRPTPGTPRERPSPPWTSRAYALKRQGRNSWRGFGG